MPWLACVSKARKELGVKGFVAIKKGTLYKRAKELYMVNKFEIILNINFKKTKYI